MNCRRKKQRCATPTGQSTCSSCAKSVLACERGPPRKHSEATNWPQIALCGPLNDAFGSSQPSVCSVAAPMGGNDQAWDESSPLNLLPTWVQPNQPDTGALSLSVSYQLDHILRLMAESRDTISQLLNDIDALRQGSAAQKQPLDLVQLERAQVTSLMNPFSDMSVLTSWLPTPL
ncbi:hypothetical protein HGRIS_014900 [Hohenbuehelia grisea]|uniref:Zn(2)-C6 fungal-type domain-containing protein n=1 Tax=Hohenbuehelia grisea TaxID=104357 RepID=A0ABR3JNL5_9AGAR